MAFSLAVAVFIFLPPLLILVVYPTSLYRKISHWISPKWRLRIKTYVETFHGSFKDGTNGTRDYRSLSGWWLFVCIVPLLIFAFISLSQLSRFFTSYQYVMSIFLLATAFFCILFQPYRKTLSNNLTAGLLIIPSMVFTTEAFIVDSQGSEAGKGVMIFLLLVPHCLLWCHVAWRLQKVTVTNCWGSYERAVANERTLLDPDLMQA